MDVQKEVIVLAVKKVNFKNDAGEAISGCQVFYSDLTPTNDDNTLGLPVSKAWLDISWFDIFNDVKEYPLKTKVHLNIDLAKGKLKPIGFEM